MKVHIEIDCTPEEARKTNEGVMQDRQHQVDAATGALARDSGQ